MYLAMHLLRPKINNPSSDDYKLKINNPRSDDYMLVAMRLLLLKINYSLIRKGFIYMGGSVSAPLLKINYSLIR